RHRQAVRGDAQPAVHRVLERLGPRGVVVPRLGHDLARHANRLIRLHPPEQELRPDRAGRIRGHRLSGGEVGRAGRHIIDGGQVAVEVAAAVRHLLAHRANLRRLRGDGVLDEPRRVEVLKERSAGRGVEASCHGSGLRAGGQATSSRRRMTAAYRSSGSSGRSPSPGASWELSRLLRVGLPGRWLVGVASVLAAGFGAGLEIGSPAICARYFSTCAAAISRSSGAPCLAWYSIMRSLTSDWLSERLMRGYLSDAFTAAWTASLAATTSRSAWVARNSSSRGSVAGAGAAAGASGSRLSACPAARNSSSDIPSSRRVASGFDRKPSRTASKLRARASTSPSAWSKSAAISGTSAADGSAIAVASPVTTVGWASSPTPTRRCVARSGGGGYRRRSGGRRRRVRVRRHGGRQLLELLHVPADEVEVLGRGLFVAAHVVVLRGRLEHLVVGPGQELVRVRRHAVVQHLLELLFHEARDR